MRVESSQVQESTPSAIAAWQPQQSACCSDRLTSADARKLALGEVGRRLGLDFSNVTQALRTLLVRGSATGADPVPQVLDKVNKALQQAGEALRKAGLSEEQVEATLKDVRERLGASLAGSADQTLAQTTLYARRDKAKLDITTQEGDQVRIRFRSREGFVAQGATGEDGEARNVYAFASGRVSISVAGELNDEELEAIGELVSKVETLAADFFAGDLEKAFAAAAALGFDSEQIASFALKLSTREIYRGPAPQNGALPGPRTEAPTNTASTPVAKPVAPPKTVKPTAQPVSSAPVATAPSPAASAPPAAVAPVATPTTTSSTTPVDPVKATTPATLPAEVESPIVNFLRRVMELLDQPLQAGRFEFSMQWTLQVVVDAVEAADPEPASEPSVGTQLLTRSLTAIGEQLLPVTSAAPADDTVPTDRIAPSDSAAPQA